MYSAVLFGWPLTTINPMRLTSTPTDSILVASTISMARVSPFSQVGLNLTSSWSSFLGISLFATQRGQFVHDAYRTLAQPRSLHVAHLDAIGTGLTSSSASRRMPPKSRRELKYPTTVMYGSAATPKC